MEYRQRPLQQPSPQVEPLLVRENREHEEPVRQHVPEIDERHGRGTAHLELLLQEEPQVVLPQFPERVVLELPREQQEPVTDPKLLTEVKRTVPFVPPSPAVTTFPVSKTPERDLVRHSNHTGGLPGQCVLLG